MTLQLRLQLPVAQWRKQRAQYEANIQYRFGGDRSTDTTELADKRFLIPAFHTSDTADLSFPATYEVWVLDAGTGSPPGVEPRLRRWDCSQCGSAGNCLLGP